MIKDLYNYRAYILYSVRGKLISATIKNHLGILWLLFEPMLRMIVYYVVFVYLIQRRTENFTTFLLVGIIAFMWFNQSLTMGMNSIALSGRLIQQIFIPKIVFPTINVLVKTVEFLVVITVFATYIGIRYEVSAAWLALPCVILAQLLFNYGISVLAAAIVPFIPDLSFLITYGMTALFFLSGVFFKIAPNDPKYNLFMLNPLAKLLEQYRQVLLKCQYPEWNSLLIIAGIGVALIIIGSLIIKKFEYYYPRITN